MKIEIIPTKGWLYDKCENMEQLYDEYYYPLLVEIKELKNQQQEFIKYLEDMLDDDNNDIFSVVRVKDVLQKYLKVIGDKNE